MLLTHSVGSAFRLHSCLPFSAVFQLYFFRATWTFYGACTIGFSDGSTWMWWYPGMLQSLLECHPQQRHYVSIMRHLVSRVINFQMDFKSFSFISSELNVFNERLKTLKTPVSNLYFTCLSLIFNLWPFCVSVVNAYIFFCLFIWTCIAPKNISSHFWICSILFITFLIFYENFCTFLQNDSF